MERKAPRESEEKQKEEASLDDLYIGIYQLPMYRAKPFPCFLLFTFLFIYLIKITSRQGFVSLLTWRLRWFSEIMEPRN